MHESVLTKGTENSLTFCLHEVMQSLKVKEKMGHIFTAQGSFAGHQNLKNPILTADSSKTKESESDFIARHGWGRRRGDVLVVRFRS